MTLVRPARPRSTRLWAPVLLALLLDACAISPAPGGDEAEDEAEQVATREKQRPVVLDGTAWLAAHHIEGATVPAQWEHQVFASRSPTRYRATEHEGRPAMQAEAVGSNSTLNLLLTPPPGAVARRLHFSLFVPALNPDFNLGEKGADDAVARLILSFDGDRSKAWSARDHVISELSHLIAGKPLPYASIMYVWDNRHPVGSVIPNPYTDRIRHIVVASGPSQLNRWVDFDRDVEADFRLAFGEAPGPMIGLGLMSDSNNSGASVTAWYGPLALTMAAPAAAPAR